METILKTAHGKLIHGDNIEVMKKIPDNTVDSCVSDFPYDLSFMSKKWDTTGNFYEWNRTRAVELFRIIKSGGYVCIFGHPKTNHRMKCAFEDVGFNIVEEIDWVYGTGFPKNQDISKVFDKKAGAERTKIKTTCGFSGNKGFAHDTTGQSGGTFGEYQDDNNPISDLAIKWNGWKTAGLKPAHEPVTVFQKPLEGTYIQNIEKHGCGAMNIDACRIPTSDSLNGGAYSGGERCEGDWKNKSGFKNNILDEFIQPQGRFPANMVFDSPMGEVLDNQSGISQSKQSMRGVGLTDSLVYGSTDKDFDTMRGHNDTGGASRYFLQIDADDFVPFYYCAKAGKKEKGEGNTHVTVKPKELIKWLIKLVTPIDGKTIDITAGSGTHGLSCEELNKYDGYNLKWVNVEMMNTEEEPYCEIAKKRIKEVLKK